MADIKVVLSIWTLRGTRWLTLVVVCVALLFQSVAAPCFEKLKSPGHNVYKEASFPVPMTALSSGMELTAPSSARSSRSDDDDDLRICAIAPDCRSVPHYRALNAVLPSPVVGEGVTPKPSSRGFIFFALPPPCRADSSLDRFTGA